MKVAHWTLKNGSGLHRVAESLARGEVAAGLDSVLVDSMAEEEWETGVGADIHVVHSHLPLAVRTESSKVVWVGHGTPEHVFQTSMETGLSGAYGGSDPFMLSQHWLKESDAVVTFWQRHADIWRTLCDRHKKICHVPMGVERDFWKPVESRGKYAGSPSVFTAENCHYIKWPLDLFIAWPWVVKDVPDAALHVGYLPRDQHRFWFPLIQRNGALYKMYVSPGVAPPEELRNIFNSVDYYIGLVRYGDHNRICLEARAAGCKVISYEGNEYADYWLREGDQRNIARRLADILKGGVKPREAEEVEDISATVEHMRGVYEKL